MVNLKASSEDIDHLKEMFLKLDTSRDGKLSIEEISEGMETLRCIFNGDK